MKPNSDKTVTVIVQNLVKTDYLNRYENWRNGVNQELASCKGFMGLEVIPPSKGKSYSNTLEYHIIFRFDNYTNLQNHLSLSLNLWSTLGLHLLRTQPVLTVTARSQGKLNSTENCGIYLLFISLLPAQVPLWTLRPLCG